MKLEPTEAQRKAMAAAAASSRAQAWSDRIDDWLPIVDEMFAAADRIPEGAPVGTIARRPDGAWKAERKAGGSGPYWHYSTSAFWRADSPDWNSEDDADSWPVIYDPTGKTLDELHAEIDRLDKAEDSALRERDYWEETVNRILYTCSSEDEIGEWSSANDPVERFIEQFKPVKRIDPTAQQEPGESLARGLDDLAAGRVSRRDDYLEPQQEPEEDDKPEGCTECGFTAYELEDGRCDQCPPPKPRTPRVVDRLGVDEQGSLS
ncbi:hypothetical protein PP577_18695 [Mycobacteroides abscessus]|nr:hypothetical protein [Mycobacteroides abscessus]MDM2426859.1 hypothetical protein [Mycobacteroides abscessus]MDM2431811.1 hypothetical protein [Mycobacteroides abscessus]MDM2436577.1 hypothetical protein [Mycobacteroides abscessus]MDM2438876.1 hypothetical protein [Mycobacteroides abscessus]